MLFGKDIEQTQDMHMTLLFSPDVTLGQGVLSFLAQHGKGTTSDCLYDINLLQWQGKRYMEYKCIN